MRYLGIDYGGKRIGLAVSDAAGRIAFPHATVGRIEEVRDAAVSLGVGAVVIGLPFFLDGTDSEETRTVRAFAARLAELLLLPIALENEMLTTRIAERYTAGAKADASAAALILQSYLDKQSAKSK